MEAATFGCGRIAHIPVVKVAGKASSRVALRWGVRTIGFCRSVTSSNLGHARHKGVLPGMRLGRLQVLVGLSNLAAIETRTVRSRERQTISSLHVRDISPCPSGSSFYGAPPVASSSITSTSQKLRLPPAWQLRCVPISASEPYPHQRILDLLG